MNEIYEVFAGAQPVGKAELRRQGLYIRVICRCQTPTEQVYRLFAETGDSRENLGVVVPAEDGFFLDKRIPAKRLGQGRLRFFLSGSCGELRGQLTPLCPVEPYVYLESRKAAFLRQYYFHSRKQL